MRTVEVTEELQDYLDGLLPTRDAVLARMEREAHDDRLKSTRKRDIGISYSKRWRDGEMEMEMEMEMESWERRKARD